MKMTNALRNQYYAVFGPSGDVDKTIIVRECNKAGGRRSVSFDPTLVRFVFVRLLIHPFSYWQVHRAYLDQMHEMPNLNRIKQNRRVMFVPFGLGNIPGYAEICAELYPEGLYLVRRVMLTTRCRHNGDGGSDYC
jgi:hypothetical protein